MGKWREAIKYLTVACGKGCPGVHPHPEIDVSLKQQTVDEVLNAISNRPKKCEFPPCGEKKSLQPALVGREMLWLCKKHRELLHFMNFVEMRNSRRV